MRNFRLILLLTALTGGAFAADFKARLEQGNELLRKGDAAGATAIFQGLQAEEPNAPGLLFGLGCAQYLQAAQQGKDPKEAAKNLETARDSFEKAEALSSGRLSTDAGYNRANALAQLAKQPQGEKPDQKAAQEAYERSIHAYEQFLGRNPGHAKAQHNLDHMRYMLKQMEQNPPPPQQSKSDSDKQEQDHGDQQKQEQQQGGQGEQDKQEQQQGDQNQQGDSKDEQQPKDAQDDQSKTDAQQQQASQQDSTQQPPQGQQKAMSGKEKKDNETVKSLLESLENVDQEEQKRLREAPHDRELDPRWW